MRIDLECDETLFVQIVDDPLYVLTIGTEVAGKPRNRLRSGLQKITVGNWRDDSGGTMQVVSGPIGRQKVQYEALPAARVPNDMDRFLGWLTFLRLTGDWHAYE